MTTSSTLMTDTTYNGWANFETWNVSLWLNNDFNFYTVMTEWVEARLAYGQSVTYGQFSNFIKELYPFGTDDGVQWDDDNLNEEELTEMLQELLD